MTLKSVVRFALIACAIVLSTVAAVDANEAGIVGNSPVQAAINASTPPGTSDRAEVPCAGTRHDFATPNHAGQLPGGVGTGRAIGFQADSTFDISSVGILGPLLNRPFDVVIYDSPDGHSAGSVLSITTATVGDEGFVWYDIAVSFTFTAGNFYVVNWRPTDGQDAWADETTGLDYFEDFGLPATIGPITILEGIEGFDATNIDNSLHPHLRVCEGPIPVELMSFDVE